MKQLTRFVAAALALVLASPSIAANDVVYINGLPLFVSTINSGAVQAVAVYTPANAPLSVVSPNGATPVSSQIACGTSATTLLAASTSYAVRSISNQSGQPIYLGPSGVTISTGLPVPTGAGFDASHEQGALYCVAASSATVGLLQY